MNIMMSQVKSYDADDGNTFDRSALDPGADGPMTETERQEMDEYVRSCEYAPGTQAYVRYEGQCTRHMELPDVLEGHGDMEEATKQYSRRVRCYVPWDLAKQWESRHFSTRSASILLQEAMGTELAHTTAPHECRGCSGPAEYQGLFWLDRSTGYSCEVCCELYTCTSCKKSHAEVIQVSTSRLLFQPRALEEHELWRYENDIVWVGEGDDSTQYGRALQGFLGWTGYERDREKNRGFMPDPGCEKYIEACAGRRLWEGWIAKRVEEQAKAIRQWKNASPDDEPRTPHAFDPAGTAPETMEEPTAQGELMAWFDRAMVDTGW
jgi:hypothetical protein